MKLTTKIILGFLLTVFLTSLIFIIGFSFTDRKNYERMSNVNIVELSQDKKTGIELPSFKTIVIEEVPYNRNELSYGVTDKCNIYFEPITEKHSTDMLFIPEPLKDFVSVNCSVDTLKVTIDIGASIENYKNSEYTFNSVSGINILFNTSKIDIVNNTDVLPLFISNIETDSMKIFSNGDINIIDCKALIIDPVFRLSYRKLHIKNCEVRRVNLDLDNIRNWNIENCNIEEEYYTGSGIHDIKFYRSESNIRTWAPKNKDAKLNIKIQGDTTQFILR